MSKSKPTYQSVVALGLRDVGVKNDPRRLAGQIGKAALAGFALVFVSLVALCAFLALTGAGAWVLLPVMLVLITVAGALMLRA